MAAEVRAEEMRRIISETAVLIIKPVVQTLELVNRKEVRKVLDVPLLSPGASTDLKDCEAVSMLYVRHCAVTVQARLDPAASNSLRIHVRSSVDGGKWDDADVSTFDLPLAAGKTVQKTQSVSPDYLMLKVIVENLDADHPAYDVRVWVVY